jgi:hypothetical protein
MVVLGGVRFLMSEVPLYVIHKRYPPVVKYAACMRSRVSKEWCGVFPLHPHGGACPKRELSTVVLCDQSTVLSQVLGSHVGFSTVSL